MRILDLFCGAGGFACGFLQANPRNQVVLAIDNDFQALQTYRANITAQVYKKNIQEVHACEILKLLDDQTPDIIISSPPCESFSVANPNRQRSAYNQLYADKIGRLILDTIRIIIDLEPKVFLIENVPQLASTEMKSLILHEFSRSKYRSINFNLLNAENLGVPSQRKRVFISNLELKSSNTTSSVSVNDAFQSLPKPSVEMINHELIPLSHKIARRISKTPPGGAIVYFKGSHRGTFRNFIRLQANQPSPTVMGKSRFIHPYDPRLCTVREHARLMSYSDNFQFYGSIDSQYNQVGESVPPLMAKVVAQQVLTDFPKNSKKVF
ncbi:MAG: DNA cytosine methyltransferase [Candidatus Hodarchaeota archaeon]